MGYQQIKSRETEKQRPSAEAVTSRGKKEMEKQMFASLKLEEEKGKNYGEM